MSDPSFNPMNLEQMSQKLRTEQVTSLLAQNWWAIGLRGLCGIIFGLIALFMPAIAILSLVYIAGIYMLVDGVLCLVAAWRAGQAQHRWGWLTFEGIIDILAGLVAFAVPFGAAIAFVILLAAWSLVTGVFLLMAAFQYKGGGRGWMFFSAIVSILFGLVLAAAPLTGAVVLSWWIGIYAIIFGIGLIALAFKARKVQV